MSKLLLGMMVFVILNPFEIRATDIGSSSFYHLHFQYPLSHFLKLDSAHHSIYNCFIDQFIDCMQPRSKMSFYHDKHGACITISFLNCIWSNENKPNIYVGANCFEECKYKYKNKNKKKQKKEKKRKVSVFMDFV